MGTHYTFTTTIVHDKDIADEIEIGFKEYQKKDDSFIYHRIEIFNSCYFVGFIKNYGGGFYEWHTIKIPDIDMVWVSDEKDYGSNIY